MDQAKGVILRVILDLCGVRPVDGDLLICTDPCVAVVLIDQIQILELVLAIRQGVALISIA